MTAKAPKTHEVNLSIAADASILTLGQDKVVVNNDKKTVTAYTRRGVEVKAGDVEQTGTTTKFSINGSFNDAVLNGVRVECALDGHLVITAPGRVVRHIETPEDPNNTDDWVYIGNSIETGKPLYVAPEDAGVMTWNDAATAADALRREGKAGVRVPTENELKQIFNKKSRVPGLVYKENPIPGRAQEEKQKSEYWSSKSTNFGTCAKAVSLQDGTSGTVGKTAHKAVRFVRS